MYANLYLAIELDITNHKKTATGREMRTMPLTFARTGEPAAIRKIGGKEDVRQFLEKLGFVSGAVVTVISTTGGNLIVNVKDARIAIGKDMANRIMI